MSYSIKRWRAQNVANEKPARAYPRDSQWVRPLLVSREVVRGEFRDATDSVLQIDPRAEVVGCEHTDHDVTITALQNANVVPDVRQKIPGLVRNRKARNITG